MRFFFASLGGEIVDKRGIRFFSAVLFLTIMVVFLFSLFEFGSFSMLQNGFDRGNSVRQLTDGWTYTIDGGQERYSTELPCVLTLPKTAQSLTFYNTMPDTVSSGDVLRLQTVLGSYQIFIGDRLVDAFGMQPPPEKYLFACASTFLIGELDAQMRGQELRIEVSCIYPEQLAMQRAPLIGKHRDLLMSDTIDNASGLIVIVVSGIFATVLLLQYLLFLVKRQPFPVLLYSVVLLVAMILYCNVSNYFQWELWGYADSVSMSNDFNYYALQAFIPIIGYLIILSCQGKKLPKPLTAMLCLHSASSILAMALQMLWIVDFGAMEYYLALLTLVNYCWLWWVVKPYQLKNHTRWFLTPIFFCIMAYLLDYYKCVGVYFPFPQEFVTYLQLELPFMVLLPIVMPLYGLAVLYGMIDMISSEKSRLTVEVQTGRLQAQLAEKEYRSAMESFSQVRRLRHDINHHFAALTALAREGDTDALLTYLAELNGLTPAREQELPSGNFITNSFLSHYKGLCDERQITFRSQVSFCEERLKSKAHLGILLGNTLQNAYEAASKQPTPDSFVEVVIRQVKQNLMFIVKNSFTGTVKKDFQTTKQGEGHGLGLGSVRYIVEQYDGYLHLDYADGVFTVNIVLGLLTPEQQATEEVTVVC